MAGERKNKDASKDQPVVDHALIRELAQLLDETGLTEIEFERDGQRVRVARQGQAFVAAPSRPAAATDAPAPVSAAAPLDPAKHPGVVTSPMVGTAYVGAQQPDLAKAQFQLFLELAPDSAEAPRVKALIAALNAAGQG